MESLDLEGGQTSKDPGNEEWFALVGVVGRPLDKNHSSDFGGWASVHVQDIGFAHPALPPSSQP